jgi:hypothetical protein
MQVIFLKQPAGPKAGIAEREDGFPVFGTILWMFPKELAYKMMKRQGSIELAQEDHCRVQV